MVHKSKYINSKNNITFYYGCLISPLGNGVMSFHLNDDDGKLQSQVDVNFDNGTVTVTDESSNCNTYDFDLQHENNVKMGDLVPDNYKSAWYKLYFVKSDNGSMEFKIADDKGKLVFGHKDVHKHKIDQADDLIVDTGKMKQQHTVVEDNFDPEATKLHGYPYSNKDNSSSNSLQSKTKDAHTDKGCPGNLYPYWLQWIIVLILIFWLIIWLAKWLAN